MTKNKNQSIALFMTDGSPIGLQYLEQMLASGFPPAMVVISRTKKITDMAISTVRARTNNKFTWKSIDELLENRLVPVYYTDSHNSTTTHALLTKHKIDLAILGGTGIIKAQTLALPKMGVINTHPGLLPDFRGCSAVEWSVYNNFPVGATCHFVTEAIDAGDIIVSRKAKIVSGDDYAAVRFKAYNLQAEVLIAGLKILRRTDYKKFIKPNSGGHYYESMDNTKLNQVKKMLSKKLYTGYTT
ncbi:MAG: formyltransferase family protein [bacterium]|nr:formyltransferase family protein [bacterium]